MAIRQMAHHSALGDDDGTILGASKPEQVTGTVEMNRIWPLPAEVLRIAEELWDTVEETRGKII